MSKASQRGFTLIELVVVIVILGVLAAFAVPRFINLGQQARTSAVRGLEGSIRSASALAHAQFLANGSSGSTVTMEGTSVALTNGYPSAAAIRSALADLSGFTESATTPGVFQLDGAPTPASCQVAYTSATATAPPVITATATCN